MFQHIVVPLDGSALAEQALPVASQIARVSGATLTLIRVLITLDIDRGPSRGIPFDVPLVSNEERTEVAGYLSRIKRLETLEGLHIITTVLEGDAAQSILIIAQNQHADLIVMSSHGYSGLKQWALGSVAQKITHHSVIPVLILRDIKDHPTMSLLQEHHTVRVMVALDGSPLAEATIPFAITLSAVLSHPTPGALHLTRVQPQSYAETKFALQSDQAVVDVKAYLSSLEERIGSYEEAAKIATVTASVSVDSDIAGALIETAEKGVEIEGSEPLQGCDVIAMATHGREGLSRLILGSVTDRVLHKTQLPLFIVRPQTVAKTPETLQENSQTTVK